MQNPKETQHGRPEERVDLQKCILQGELSHEYC